jgi:hypothetical protein
MTPLMDMAPVDMIPHIPPPSTSTSRRVQQRQQYPSRITVDLANEAITGLNKLSVSLSAPINDITSDLPPIKCQARQPHQLQPSTVHRLHSRVYHACKRFRRLQSGDRTEVFDDSYLSNDLDSFDQNINDHGYSAVAPPRMIQSSIVSLPQHAGTASLLDVLPPHLRAVYSNPSLLLQPPATKLVHRRAFMCEQHEYIALLRRMMDKDMLAFTDKPMAVNGLFAVDKDVVNHYDSSLMHVVPIR